MTVLARLERAIREVDHDLKEALIQSNYSIRNSDLRDLLEAAAHRIRILEARLPHTPRRLTSRTTGIFP